MQVFGGQALRVTSLPAYCTYVSEQQWVMLLPQVPLKEV